MADLNADADFFRRVQEILVSTEGRALAAELYHLINDFCGWNAPADTDKATAVSNILTRLDVHIRIQLFLSKCDNREQIPTDMITQAYATLVNEVPRTSFSLLREIFGGGNFALGLPSGETIYTSNNPDDNPK